MPPAAPIPVWQSPALRRRRSAGLVGYLETLSSYTGVQHWTLV